MPSQRFEGLGAAAEAVVKSDCSYLESRESRDFFCSSLSNLPKFAVNLAKHLDNTHRTRADRLLDFTDTFSATS